MSLPGAGAAPGQITQECMQMSMVGQFLLTTFQSNSLQNRKMIDYFQPHATGLHQLPNQLNVQEIRIFQVKFGAR